jgi:hypothetical protein
MGPVFKVKLAKWQMLLRAYVLIYLQYYVKVCLFLIQFIYDFMRSMQTRIRNPTAGKKVSRENRNGGTEALPGLPTPVAVCVSK